MANGNAPPLGEKTIDRLRHLFNNIDKDNSGTIALEEFVGACREISITPSPEELRDFNVSDQNNDAQLDFQEFCQFYSTRLWKVFCEIDVDGSGRIDHVELMKAFQMLGYKTTEREAKAVLAKIDMDNNREVDFEEFSNSFCSLPSPNTKAIIEKWASGLSIDTGSDLTPPVMPPSSVEIWKALIAGGVAGMVSRTVTAPLERAKIIAQTQTSASAKVNVVSFLRSTWLKERWKGLFAGNGANCFRVVPFSALVCLAYYNMAKNFPLDEGIKWRSTTMRVSSGALAGLFATFFTYPIDVVRAKLTVQDQTSKTYTGIRDAMKAVSTSGRLYKGFWPTALSIAPSVAIQQISYDLLKNMAENRSMTPSIPLFLFCGCLAGLTSQTAIYPLEVMRRRIQVESCQNNHGALYLLRKLSYREIFGGLSATYIKIIPAASISLLTRDALLGRLNKN